jgi:hypothetical protein
MNTIEAASVIFAITALMVMFVFVNMFRRK